MPDIIVKRGAGIRPGADIIDPLLTTVGACLARGQMELDEHHEGLQSVTLEVIYRDGLLLGQIVEVYDEYEHTVYYGKITGISHAFQQSVLTTTLKLVRPTDFEVL